MENYEQKLKEIINSNNTPFADIKILSKYFPELCESEDERIRKEIIQFLQLPHPQFVGKRNYEEWISWLEKQGEQKPAWSEEDDSRICQIIDWLSICKTYNPDQKSVCDISMQIAWLKSIKPNHWKPSEEQMKAIINSAQGLYQCKEKEVLLDLYEQLKKL